MPLQVSNNQRIIALVLVFLVMIIASGLSTTMVLYETAFENTRKNLIDTVHLEASTLSAMHELNEFHIHLEFNEEDEAILKQFIKGMETYRQANEAVEIEIAIRKGDDIVFLLGHHLTKSGKQQTIPFGSELAEPMHHALSGRSGTVVGLDYQGNNVLAAYQYIEPISLGVVAKMDIEKIRRPFARAAFYIFMLSTILVVLGVYLFVRIGTPIIGTMQTNEKRFRSLFNESTYFSALLSPDGKVLMINDTAKQLFDLEPDKYLNKPIYTLPFWRHSEDEQEKIFQTITEILPRVAIRFETTCILPNSKIIGVDFSLKSITDNHNNIVNIIAEGNDISDLLNIQKNLQESKKRYQSLIESSEAIPWEMNLDMVRFIFVGEQAFEVLGYPLWQWYEDNFWAEHIHPDDVSEVMAFCENCLRRDGNYDHKYRMISPNGDTIWFHNYLNVTYKQGKPATFTGYMFDISKQIEHETQIRRSQKMDALGKLTGGIAHDYNNMLGIILGYAKMLMSKLGDQPDLLKYVQRISEAGERNAKLTQKLLAFSRRDASETEQLNINNLLEETQHLLEKTLTARIRLKMHLSSTLWDVKIDKNEFVDALLNMSINAMHAIEENGELVITTDNVKLGEVEASSLQIRSGEYVLLTLADNGKGMDENTQAKIFDPFFSTKGEQGTGLGLSQVYGFINQIKGAIKVKSQTNKGTQFSIYIPRSHLNKEEITVDNRVIHHESGNELILIVDDEPMLAEMTGEHLKVRGYQVIYAENAVQALEILEKQKVDLMLSDVIMPGIDGFQLALKVKTLYPSIKIQLVSGFNDDKHLDGENRLVEPDLYKNLIYKPFEVTELISRIRSLLDNEDDFTMTSESEIKKMDKYLSWDEDYRINVDEIDKDHQYIFELFNFFQISIGLSDEEKIAACFDQWFDYIKFHFQREELIMQVCRYPALNKHKQVHKLFKKQIQAHYIQFSKGQLNSKELIDLCRNWTVEHVIGMDQTLRIFCTNKQDEIAEALASVKMPHLTMSNNNE